MDLLADAFPSAQPMKNVVQEVSQPQLTQLKTSKEEEDDDDDFGDFNEFEDPNDVQFPAFVDPEAPKTE